MLRTMASNQYALVHGARSLRATLEGWQQDPWALLRRWFAVSAAIGVLLLVGVYVVASAIKPDIGFNYVPSQPQGAEAVHVLDLVARNSLVLALHAFACIAGFIAGVSLPLATESKRGISRWSTSARGRWRSPGSSWSPASRWSPRRCSSESLARPSPTASRSRPAS
jgi:hypothetical protein